MDEKTSRSGLGREDWIWFGRDWRFKPATSPMRAPGPKLLPAPSLFIAHPDLPSLPSLVFPQEPAPLSPTHPVRFILLLPTLRIESIEFLAVSPRQVFRPSPWQFVSDAVPQILHPCRTASALTRVFEIIHRTYLRFRLARACCGRGSASVLRHLDWSGEQPPAQPILLPPGFDKRHYPSTTQPDPMDILCALWSG
jgi:hypothetical protein